ncbi:MAG: type II toxin-antitoxin system RelE/ParE family toxin [Methylococcales bacterium]|nr:type II toxin-antitoxin system RelE/ParE family toxin [Methylococcales bacterium]
MWSISFENKALKAFNKLDNPIKQRVIKFLIEVEKSENPRLQGKALTGKYKGLWVIQVRDYQLICNIQDNQVIILILTVGHRKKIYK